MYTSTRREPDIGNHFGKVYFFFPIFFVFFLHVMFGLAVRPKHLLPFLGHVVKARQGDCPLQLIRHYSFFDSVCHFRSRHILLSYIFIPEFFFREFYSFIMIPIYISFFLCNIQVSSVFPAVINIFKAENYISFITCDFFLSVLSCL